MSSMTNTLVPEVGMTVQKDFDGEPYWGSITAIDEDDNGVKLYHIKYDDGDEEDMDYDECFSALKEKPDDDSSEDQREV